MGQMGEGSIIFVTFLHKRFLRYEKITPKVLRCATKNGSPQNRVIHLKMSMINDTPHDDKVNVRVGDKELNK